MPRQSKIIERSHKQYLPQEFRSNTPNVKGAARTLDPYHRPAEPGTVPVDPDVRLFQSSMDNLADAMGLGARAYKHTQEEARDRGKADSAAKKEPQETGDAYTYGYQLISGRAAAGELEAKLDEHIEANKDDPDPEKFVATQQHVIRQFLAGRSQAFIEGLTPVMLDAEERRQKAFVLYTKQKVAGDVLGKVAISFEDDINKLYADPSKDNATKAKEAREILTGAQMFTRPYGVDRTQTSEHLLTLMGEKAVQTGKPELMDFAFEPDADGVSLSKRQELAKKVMVYHRQAEHVKDGMAREALAERKAAESAKIDELTMALIDASDKKDAKQIQQLGAQIRALGDPNSEGRIQLQVNRYKQLVRAYDKVTAPARENPTASNPDALRHYNLKASQGLLDNDDLDLAESQLSRSDFKAIIRKDASNKVSNPAKREYDRLGKQLLRKVSKSDGSIFENDADAEKYYETSMELEARYQAFVEKNKRPPGLPEIKAIHEQILKSKKAAGELIDEEPASSKSSAPSPDKRSIRERLLKSKNKE
jgi:hypothetical protein